MPHTFANLIKADGSFDRAEIMRDAVRMARVDAFGPLLPGLARQSYPACFAACLKLSWACAKAASAEFVLSAAEIARREERASALFDAQMIDETARSFSVRNGIEGHSSQGIW